ncbi:MAG: CHAT domain-containing protein [Cyclobacteriaceae bacterium]|nr:MAG: CHAT domain-containing protein [Cyclobacteriaceae bacterium]
MKRSFLSFSLMLISLLVAGQVKNDIISQIDALLFDSRYTEAIQKIDQQTNGNVDTQIRLMNKKAEALIGLGKYEDADKLLQEAITKCKDSKNNKVLQAITQSSLGYLYLNQGKFDQALEQLTVASATLQERGSPLETAQALTNLGSTYNSTGKYLQAEEQFQMALSLRQSELPDTHELIANSYNNLGFVNNAIDPDKAIEYFEKATAIYEKLYGKDHSKMAIANTNLGFAYAQIELYGDAINYYETALAIWEKVNPQPTPSKAFVLSSLGYTYTRLNDNKTALEFYNKAMAMYEASYGKKHPDIAALHNRIGNIHQSSDNYDEALKSYQAALIANVNDFNSENIETNPAGTNFYNGNQLLYSMMYKAQVVEARHLGKTLKQSDLDLGLKFLKDCDALIDRLRQQATNEADKITLGSIANEVYADGVRIAFLLSDVAFKNRKYYREQCFYFAEKSKSAVLLGAISDTNAKSFAGVPEDLLQEENSLKAALALVAQKLAQKPTEEEEKYLRETAFHLNQSYQSFIQNLEKQYPEYFNLKYNVASPSIADIQKRLNSKTAVISYFIDDSKRDSPTRLYTYIITHKSFKITDQKLPDDYDRSITGLRNGLFYMGEDAYIASAVKLHNLLIPKISRSIKDLVVLPTGRMSVIPFEALLTKPVKDFATPYPSLPYLLKKYAVRYEFSAGLLLQKKDTGSSSIASALLCAPVNFPSRDNLNALPGTEQEINTIQNLLASKNISTEVLLQGKANETAIKSDKLKSHTLIHLATHGIVDENNPELSRIFLQTDSEAEDGNLFSGEIYNLHLNADLVTLSACQTGLGKISKGEGVIGLSRALVYAGAKNIMVSFWSVADESTAVLMTDFYKLLLEKPAINYSENLRAAKLNMINSKFAAPYYWAPFILIGF